MKEEKPATVEEEEFGEEEIDEAAEEEDESAKLEEWMEQLKDIESLMEQTENGKLPDHYVLRLLKSMLQSNICQNQGYVLDGYPKTIPQVNFNTCTHIS